MPVEIKNLKKAANRILSAIKKNERIIIYGDADLDGVTSVIILKETIENLGCTVAAVYFPDRENEGYGISEIGLDKLKAQAPALFIALDCGISNFKEVKLAKKMGFEVIIIDHHEILEKLPEASIIVDPKQKGDKYPFKQFAAVGIVFKLSELLLKAKIQETLRKNFLELVALATIADMMPRTDENKTMIIEGLGSLESSWRPGIQALFEVKFFKSFSLLQQVSKINSLLNIRNIQNQLPAAFRVLTAPTKSQAKKLIERLLEKSFQKREKIGEIKETIEEEISESPEKLISPIIFEGSSFWQLIYLGVVASMLSRKYQKPVFLFKKGKTESQGSTRGPSGCNLVVAMKSCSKYLITYGGHPPAAGFGIKNENLEKFKECLVRYFK